MHTLLADDVAVATTVLRFGTAPQSGPRLRASGVLRLLPAFAPIRACFEGPPPPRPFSETGRPSLVRPLGSYTFAVTDAAGTVLPARRIRVLEVRRRRRHGYAVVVEFDDTAAGVWARALDLPRAGGEQDDWGADDADA